LIYHFAMRIITREVNSIGRLDYILHEYYTRDLERGLITRREAAEWLQVPRIKSAVMTGQSDSIVIAGSYPDGSPFWNDLTYFILDASKGLKMQGPQIWFRYAEGQPRELLRRAFAPIKAGIAQPGFYNDAIAVKAMTKAGFAKEHAYDYVCCQCIELS
jgi:formate C-acetyltransferase